MSAEAGSDRPHWKRWQDHPPGTQRAGTGGPRGPGSHLSSSCTYLRLSLENRLVEPPARDWERAAVSCDRQVGRCM